MSKHCVVIGAGIVGVSCAWHLQREGLKVTLIDHQLPGQSCSFGNASCLSTSSVIPFSYPGMIRKVPGWMLDPLGPMRIRPMDFPALIPWFWKFWRCSNMQQVVAIAEAQTQLMQTALADYDEILKATDSRHLNMTGVQFTYTILRKSIVRTNGKLIYGPVLVLKNTVSASQRLNLWCHA